MVTKPTIWPNGRFGVPQITPYTYRDGQTLLELITSLRDHVVEQLHPNLQKAIDKLVADVEAEYEKSHDRYVDGVQEFQRIHDAFMADVNAKLVALNDTAISDLVQDETSRISKILKERFATHEQMKQYAMDAEAFRKSVHDDLTAKHHEVQEAFNEFEGRFDSFHNDVRDSISTIDQRVDSVGDRITKIGPTPYDFGAVGDGKADDTEPLNTWAQHGGYFAPGVYKLTEPIQVNKDHVKINGHGQVTLVMSQRYVPIRIVGDHACVEGITIDGQLLATGGVKIDGNYGTVRNMVIRDLESPTSATAINMTGHGFVVESNVVDGVRSTGISPSGSGTGMARACQIYWDKSSDAPTPSVIRNNVFKNIFGQEGDAITILNILSVGGVRWKSGVLIENNLIDSCSRRHIKIQSSGCTVRSNTLIETNKSEEYIHTSNTITSIDSHNTTITDNWIGLNRLGANIVVYGQTSQVSNVFITNNQLDVNSAYGINVMNHNRFSVSGNTVRLFGRGVAVRCQDSRFGQVSNNSVFGSVNADASNTPTFHLLSDCYQNLVSGNHDSVAGRNVSITNSGMNSKTMNNSKI